MVSSDSSDIEASNVTHSDPVVAAQREVVAAQRDSAIAKRDSAIAKRDGFFDSEIFKTTKPFQPIKNPILRWRNKFKNKF